MPIMRDALGIVFSAGLLATGVHQFMPRSATTTAAVDTVPGGGASGVTAPAPAFPSASASETERSQALERLRNAMAAARAQAPAEPPPAPAQTAQAAPAETPAPAVGPAPSAQPPRDAVAAVDGKALPPDRRTEPQVVPGEVKPQLPPADIAWTPTPRPELIAKADASFDNGDVAGARLWLELALERGDADAAFRLAETYDPAVLAEWKVIGVASDVGKARTLYQRAASGGVETARQRMAKLSD